MFPWRRISWPVGGGSKGRWVRSGEPRTCRIDGRDFPVREFCSLTSLQPWLIHSNAPHILFRFQVRNRESAAASRQRIRNRINELELEVEDWKTKYETAMQRLEQLNSATDV